MTATISPCDLCGGFATCVCLEAECRLCGGEGNVVDPKADGAQVLLSPETMPCPDCMGEGWIKCRGSICRFSHCYCEAAWDAQEADRMSEPPISAAERHRMAWQEKQIAKGRMA
jgi:hypothetical protein